MARGLKVASFEDIAKMDKVGIAYILMNFHVTKADLLKQNLPMDRLLNNFTAINYSIEGFLLPTSKRITTIGMKQRSLKSGLFRTRPGCLSCMAVVLKSSRHGIGC